MTRLIVIGLSCIAGMYSAHCAAEGPSAKQTYDKIVAEATHIRPPVLRDMPAPLSRDMFGALHEDPDFVPFRCEYVLNPDGSSCDVSTKIMGLAMHQDEMVRATAYRMNVFRSRAVDPELKRLGLDKHFKYASGEQGNSVRAFGASPEGVTFLIDYPWGMMPEIKAAAADYCAAQGRQAVIAGAAEACMSPRRTKYTLGAGGMKSENTRLSPQEQGDGREKQWETWLMVPVDCR